MEERFRWGNPNFLFQKKQDFTVLLHGKTTEKADKNKGGGGSIFFVILCGRILWMELKLNLHG